MPSSKKVIIIEIIITIIHENNHNNNNCIHTTKVLILTIFNTGLTFSMQYMHDYYFSSVNFGVLVNKTKCQNSNLSM